MTHTDYFPVPEGEDQRISELHDLGILDTEREKDFDLITALAAQICGAPFAFVSFVDQRRVWIKSGHGSDLAVVDRSNSYCAVAIMEPDVVVIPNLRADHRTASLPFTLDSNVNMYAGAILTTESGLHLGTLCVVDTEVRTLTEAQKSMLQGLSNQVMQLVQLRRNRRELEITNQRLQQSLVELKAYQGRLVQNQKIEALGVLVAGVSHELNTPIGTGLTVASALQSKVLAFDQLSVSNLSRTKLRNFVDDVSIASELLVRNLRNAASLMDNLKQVPIERALWQRNRFSLANLVDTVLHNHLSAIDAAGGQVVTDVPTDLVLESYPESLSQVLHFLLDNALLHGIADARNGQITVRAQSTLGNWVTLEVEDTGKGIEPVHMEHLFEPFFTTRLGQGGGGLGLYSTHNIVTGVLGGNIEVRSNPGLGTCVTLSLPLVAK